MPYIAPEVIEQARQIDLLTYLKNCEPHELVRISGNNYTTRSHDSLKISNGKWMWWSQRIGGYNALDYLVKVRGFSFVEAVETLMGKAAVMPTLTVRPKQSEKPKTLLLPEKSKTTDKIRDYLFSRGIDAAITDECIKKGIIFESLPYHNIVFVGFGENKKPKYAAFRATNSHRILGDCSGSDKHYSFRLQTATATRYTFLNVLLTCFLTQRFPSFPARTGGRKTLFPLRVFISQKRKSRTAKHRQPLSNILRTDRIFRKYTFTLITTMQEEKQLRR